MRAIYITKAQVDCNGLSKFHRFSDHVIQRQHQFYGSGRARACCPDLNNQNIALRCHTTVLSAGCLTISGCDTKYFRSVSAQIS